MTTRTNSSLWKTHEKVFFLSEHQVDTGLYNEQKKHRYIFPFLQRNAPTIVGKGGFPDVDLWAPQTYWHCLVSTGFDLRRKALMYFQILSMLLSSLSFYKKIANIKVYHATNFIEFYDLHMVTASGYWLVWLVYFPWGPFF